MSGIVWLFAAIAAGVGLAGFMWWLERFSRRPGLAALVGGLLLLLGTALMLSVGDRILAALFGILAVLAFWQSWGRMVGNRVPRREK